MRAPGYVRFGGNVVVDEARTYHYLREYGDGWSVRNCECSHIVDGPYTSPAADAPWYVPTRPESGDFLGVILDSITTSAPVTRQVKPHAAGSFIGPENLPGVTLTFTGALTARTREGMWWGKRWLTDVLRTPCTDCSTSDLCLLPVCPPPGDPDPDRYFRTLYDAALVNGPVFGEFPVEDLVLPVTWTMVSSTPWWNGDVTAIGTETVSTAMPVRLSATGLEWVEKTALRLTIDGGDLTRKELIRVQTTPSTVAESVFRDVTALWRAENYDGSGTWNSDDLTPFVATPVGAPIHLTYEGDAYAYFEAISPIYTPSNGIDLPADVLSTPIDGSGLCVDIKIRPDSWEPVLQAGYANVVIGKNGIRTDPISTRTFSISFAARQITGFFGDGTATYGVTANVPFSDGEDGYFRFQFMPGSAGYARVGYRRSEDEDWVQLAQTNVVAGLTLAANALPIRTGGDGSNLGMLNRCRVYEVRGGRIPAAASLQDEGDLLWGYNMNDCQEPQTTVPGYAGETWAIRRCGDETTLNVVDRPCIFLDGTNDYFTIPDNAAFDLALADSATILVAARVQDTSVARAFIAKRATTGTTTGWDLRVTTTPEVQAGIGDGTNSTVDVEAGVLANTALVAGFVRNRTADNLRAYRDNLNTAAVTDTMTATSANATSVYLGAMTGATDLFRGQIMGVAVWRRALTPTELLEAAEALYGGTTDAEAGCGSFTVTYLDEAEQLIVDSSRRSVQVINRSTGQVVAGLDRLTFDGVFEYPILGACGELNIDVDALAGDAGTGVDVTLETVTQELM